MFSGIIEAQSKVIATTPLDLAIRMEIHRPPHFSDIRVGDSLCTNGVCLTIEKFDLEKIQLCLGAETLKILDRSFENWLKYPLNIERSLRLGDRVHGHLVTGHVDGLARILKTYAEGESWQMRLEIPKLLHSFFWKKGSVCLNGVSLTVNEVYQNSVSGWIEVCLIPETMQKTNLKFYDVDQFLSVESDYLAKAYINSQSNKEGSLS